MTAKPSEAWVRLPTDEEVRQMMPPPPSPLSPGYTFGFAANMGRLQRAHPRIGFKFSALFAEIMFAPGALTRAEREMVAGIAAAAQDCYY